MAMGRRGRPGDGVGGRPGRDCTADELEAVLGRDWDFYPSEDAAASLRLCVQSRTCSGQLVASLILYNMSQREFGVDRASSL